MCSSASRTTARAHTSCRRAFLLLNAKMGIAEGFCQGCFGSTGRSASDLRETLKRPEAMLEWGLPAGATPVRT